MAPTSISAKRANQVSPPYGDRRPTRSKSTTVTKNWWAAKPKAARFVAGSGSSINRPFKPLRILQPLTLKGSRSHSILSGPEVVPRRLRSQFTLRG